MEDIRETAPAIKPVRAILHGGPESIPHESRVQLVSSLGEKIKLSHNGGYEHFERSGALDAGGAGEEIIFRWTMRTEMAE